MKKNYPLAVVLLLTFIHLHAQEIKDTVVIQAKNLPEVEVVSPFNSVKNSPLTFSLITSQQLEKKNYGQEPSLILSELPSATFYTDAGSSSGYSYFRIRGIDQTRINMSLNGVPLNEPEDQGVYFSNYPDFLQSVSTIQQQRGSGYSKNGTAAYGGSLYFESLKFKDSTAYQVSAGYGSFNYYRLNGSINTGLKKNMGLYASASHLHSDGYKNHSGNTSSSFFMNTGYWGKQHKLYLLSFIGDQRNGLAWIGAPLDSINKNPRYNANSSNEKDAFMQGHLQLHYEWQITNKNLLHTGIFYNYLDGNYDFDLNNFLGLPPGNELYNYAFRSNFAGLFSYHSYTTNRIKWYTGIHSQWYARKHTGSEKNTGILYTNTGYRKEANMFTKMILTTGKWNCMADVQYRYSAFTYTGNEVMPGQYWNFLNVSLGMGFAVNSRLQLYYSMGEIHREPTRNDLFLGNDDLVKDDNGNLLFNPVKPEQAIDHELGVRFFPASGHLYANLYYMRFRNEITLNGQIGPTGVPLHSNAASSFRSGIELDALHRFNNGIELRNQSSISFNRINENDIHLQPVLTPVFISNQEIRMVKSKWQTGFGFRYQSKSYIDYANAETLPSWFIVNWDGSLQFKKIVLFTVVNNISNRQYYTNGLITATGQTGYFVQAPINFFTGIRFKW